MDIELIRRQMKSKRKIPSSSSEKVPVKKRPRLFSFIIRVMVLSILFLGALIYTKASTNNKQFFYDLVFKDNISFAPINNLYNKYLGGILPFKDIVKDNKPVFKEKLAFNESNIYKDGVALSVDKEYLVPAIDSGIVVFIGDKEDYGKTVIVQQVNGIDVWYGNVTNLNVKMYDYVEGGGLLGETVSDKLYMVFKKDGKVLDYKKYIQ